MTPSYALGLTFILLVALIWSFASVLVKHVYDDLEFDSPFLLTYVCTSLFVILLPSRLVWERLFSKEDVVPWRSSSSSSLSTVERNDDDDDEAEETRLIESGVANAEDVVVATERRRGDDDDEPRGRSITIEAVRRSPNNDDDEDDERVEVLGHVETALVSCRIAPVWFLSNYFYNLSLRHTSIASSTVLASTGSLFTYTFSVCAEGERVTCRRIVGVSLCVVGSLVTALADQRRRRNDGNDASGSSAFGDAMGLLSAVGYGVYTVTIRTKCPKDERAVSMQLVLGYLGLLNAVALSPIVAHLFAANRAAFDHLDDDNVVRAAPAPLITGTVLGWLALKGSIDNVLSDYLWARAVMLTDATVATVGMGLTIPLAFLGDWWRDGILPSLGDAAGALSVLFGFVLVNL